MPRFRKKPVEVEAVRVADAHHAAERDWKAMPKWLADAYDQGKVLFLHHPRRIELYTLEGVMTGDYDDWIIQGVKGELYPCKPDVFEQTYEPA